MAKKRCGTFHDNPIIRKRDVNRLRKLAATLHRIGE